MTVARLFRIVRQRARSLWKRRDLDADLDREMAFHLEQLAREKTADGLPADQARRAALREFGNVVLAAEQSRDARGWTWLADLGRDIGYGARLLRASPVFTAVSVTSLALGIGATVAIAGAIDAVLVRRLPFPDADRLVTIRTYRFDAPDQRSGSSMPDYVAWREGGRSLDAFGVSLGGPRDLGADRNGAPADRIAGQSFTPGLFSMLGIRPLLGRLFEDTDDPYSPAARVVVISHRLWQERFGGDVDVIGRQISVSGVSRAVIGVMPPDFRFQDDNVDCWVPLILVGHPTMESSGAARVYNVTARLKPGVSIDQAQAELDGVAARLALEAPASHLGWGVRLESLGEAMYGWTRARLVTLAAAVTLVLVIACVNVAGLLLSRGSVRHREVAVRLALGASRGRIVRQLLTESMLLAVAGGALGLLVARWGLSALSAALGPPPGAPRVGALGLDAGALAATVLLSIITALAFGLAPAVGGSRRSPGGALNASAPAAGTPARPHRQRGLFVMAEIGLAHVLLIGAALLLTSFVRLSSRELNVDPQGVVSFEYTVPPASFARAVGADRGMSIFEVSATAAHTLEQILERLRAMPGVESAAGISYPPVNSLVLPTMTARLDDRSPAGDAREVTAAYFLSTPGLLSTLRIPLVRGRDVDARDTSATPWVAVVNEAMARQSWPGEDAVGRRLTIDAGTEEQTRTVVGVVKDVPTRLGLSSPQPVIYASYQQQPARYRGRWVGMFGEMTFAIRLSQAGRDLLPAIRQAVAAVTPDRPVANVGTIERHVGARLDEQRNYVIVLSAFATTATLLAVIGVYGVMSYAVNERSREIGIRKALGARRADVAAALGRRAAVLVGSGVLVGLSASFALTRLIVSQLWGVTPTDPATFAEVSGLLVVAALAACVAPLGRALRVDPSVTLRSE